MFHRNSFRAVAAAVFLSGLALSAVGADPRMPGDPLVESIRAAYARVGRVQPFTSFPVTEDELRRAVEELARDPAVDGASCSPGTHVPPSGTGGRGPGPYYVRISHLRRIYRANCTSKTD